MDLSKQNSAELQNFLEQEKKKAMVNEMVAKVTKECWDKCITGTPGSKFSSSESNCLSNCARSYAQLKRKTKLLNFALLYLWGSFGLRWVSMIRAQEQRYHRHTPPIGKSFI